MTMRKRVYSALCDRLNSRVYAVLSYVGGIYLNDIREKDVIPSYSMVDREKQKAALNRVRLVLQILQLLIKRPI
mgnify:CR=1 FL=1